MVTVAKETDFVKMILPATAITILLFCAPLIAAQEKHIRNFQVASQNSTHITFSWDIVDGYYSSSYISYFYLYYQYVSVTRSLQISYSSAAQITSSTNVTTFMNTRSLENFREEQYIMWVRVYRSRLLDPMYTTSERAFVNLSLGIQKQEVTFEFKIHLWPSQTCHDFLETASAIDPYFYFEFTHMEVFTGVYWILFQSCRCTLPYDFEVRDGYFTCATSAYVVFRVKLSSKNSMLDLTFLTSNLTDVLNGDKGNRQITVKGGKYLLSPGPCGVTVSDLDSPHCFNDTRDSESMTNSTHSTPDSTFPPANISNTPTVSNTDSALPIVAQNNTAFIIATAFAAMFFTLAMGLIAYLCIVTRKIMQGNTLKAAKEENCANKLIEREGACSYAVTKPEEISTDMDDF